MSLQAYGFERYNIVLRSGFPVGSSIAPGIEQPPVVGFHRDAHLDFAFLVLELVSAFLPWCTAYGTELDHPKYLVVAEVVRIVVDSIRHLGR